MLPLAHNFPLDCPGMQGFLLYGARTVLSTSTRTGDMLRLTEQEKITHIELVPALLIRLLDDPTLKERDLSPLCIINTGG